jgi:hypothetical protein
VSESRRSRRHGEEPARDPDERPAAPAQVAQPERQTVPVRAVEPQRVAVSLHTAATEPRRLPESIVPPPPAPRVRPAPLRPSPIQQAVWTPAPAPILSPDGAWLWTGSAWVPAWWGGPTVPPPPPYAGAVRVRPARSGGCASAFAMGCAVVLFVTALVTIALLAAADGLFRLPSG